jgi:hypothetical protein
VSFITRVGRRFATPLNDPLGVTESEVVKFDIYEWFQLEVEREADAWVVYRLAPGKRVRADDLIIPSEVQPDEVATCLDDLFHEGAAPGKVVRRLA